MFCRYRFFPCAVAGTGVPVGLAGADVGMTDFTGKRVGGAAGQWASCARSRISCSRSHRDSFDSELTMAIAPSSMVLVVEETAAIGRDAMVVGWQQG